MLNDMALERGFRIYGRNPTDTHDTARCRKGGKLSAPSERSPIEIKGRHDSTTVVKTKVNLVAKAEGFGQVQDAEYI